MNATRTTIAASFLTIAALAAFNLGAVAQPPKPESLKPAAHALSSEDDQAIRKVVAGFEETWNAHDMKAMGKLFREDAEFINVVGMHWHGRDEIMAAHAAFHETVFKTRQMKTDGVETRPLGSGYAIAVATITVDGFTTPSGQVMPKGQCRETFVLVKGADGWKVAHGHNVTVVADAAKHDPAKSPKK